MFTGEVEGSKEKKRGSGAGRVNKNRVFKNDCYMAMYY